MIYIVLFEIFQLEILDRYIVVIALKGVVILFVYGFDGILFSLDLFISAEFIVDGYIEPG